MAFENILHKLVIVEIVFIIIKAGVIIWLAFAKINLVSLAVVAIGSGIALKLIYTGMRWWFERKARMAKK